METTLQIFDVQEKEVEDVKSPSFPSPSQSSTGFPQHKKRTKASAFKQRRQAEQTTSVTSDISGPRPSGGREESQISEASYVGGVHARRGLSADETRRIDQENKDKIDKMSPEEIESAQREIFSSLDPDLIQKLLRRANLDEEKPSLFDLPTRDTTQKTDPTPNRPEISEEDTSRVEKRGATKQSESANPDKPKKSVTFDADAAPPASPSENDHPHAATNTHFPKQNVPDLDPNDPDFLDNLHKKFFPNLPADPSKLAWMAPLPTPHSTADRESPYYPGQDSLPVSALRFDFTGSLIPPRLSRQIPVTKGLHHHGVAPEAAGYTIPELARLARSAVPGQRCIAFQTLGRMLFRLGNGVWGIGEGGRAGEEDDLAFGMWRCFLETRVLETLNEAASVEDGAGHMASKAYAVEALWLFEKGGWKEKWRGM